MWEYVPAGTQLELLLDLIKNLDGSVENFSAHEQDDWYKIWNPEGNEFHYFRASVELDAGCKGLIGRLRNMKGVKECLPPTL